MRCRADLAQPEGGLRDDARRRRLTFGVLLVVYLWGVDA